MEEVRAALGYPQLDLFAMSYGTRPALDYLRLFPDRVGQTVIRAAAPSAMTIPLWGPRDTQAAFDRLVEACAAQSDCASRHPDLSGDLRTLLQRLDEGPMPVTFLNPANGQQVSSHFDRDALGSVLFFLLYIPEYLAQIPPLLDAAAKGDASGLISAAAPFVLGINDQLAWGMYRSVICNEDVRRIDPASVEGAASNTFMGAESVMSDIQACAEWPQARIPDDYFAPVRSDKEVFIISGEFDPVAGRIWGDTIASDLPNSVHVEVAGASHMPPLPGCTDALVARFLDGEALKTIDMACLGESERPRLRVASSAPRS
jgi:pimeloyl-ACP methyl ester carboxylesterase